MKIGVIAAMAEEAESLIKTMQSAQTTNIGNQRFFEGEINGSQVVVVQSGIGKVNASIATTLMIVHFNVAFVINSGSAGGIGEGMSIGDLVVSTELTYHDADARAFGYQLGQIPQMPVQYEVQPKYYQLAHDLGNQLGWQVRLGGVVTGDAFIASEADVTRTRTNFPNALVTEMEGAAVAQTCYQFGIDYLVIRAVSDVADEVASVNFDEFIIQAGRDSADLVIALIKEISDR